MQWAKLWTTKWLASPRVRQTTYAQHGLWLAIFARLHADGSEDARRWTADDLAADLGLSPSRRKRFHRDIAALEAAGLLDILDGHLHLPRFNLLQQRKKRP